MKAIRKHSYVAWIAARSHLAYVGEAVSRFFFLAVILYIFLRVWEVSYRVTGATELGGLTLAQMMWYLAVTESIMLSGPRISQKVDADIRSGLIGVHLLRPISYPIYSLWTTLGERAVRFAMSFIAGSLIAFLLVGPIDCSGLGLLHLVLALPLAFLLDFLGNFLVGLGAFWMEDTNGLLLMYSRVTMILGGMLIPLELFPEIMQPALRALPFSAIVYGPARIFVHPDWFELFALLLRQSIGAVAMGLGVWLVYSLAMRRVITNGG